MQHKSCVSCVIWQSCPISRTVISGWVCASTLINEVKHLLFVVMYLTSLLDNHSLLHNHPLLNNHFIPRHGRINPISATFLATGFNR
jgi:hypothetical protein